MPNRPIQPFFWPMYPAPVTTYTQEFTALEMMGALTAKLNEIIQRLNTLEQTIDNQKTQ